MKKSYRKTNTLNSNSNPFRKERNWGRKKVLAASLALSVIATGLLPVSSVDALTRLTSSNNVVWEIHDSFAPNLDTGSLRTVSTTQAQGFGNIFVKVSSTPDPIMNGQMIRGFGLTYDGDDTFTTTQAVNLGNVLITREVYFDSENNRVRYLDTFTNMNEEATTVDVSFGGSLGYGTTSNAAQVKASSTGDLDITTEDSWMVVDSQARNNKPVAVVIGSPQPFEGDLSFIGNQQKDPFTIPRATSGNDANFFGFVHTLEVESKQSKSLLHYVQVGETGEEGLTATINHLNNLSTTPDVKELTPAQVCTINNWDLTTIESLESGACDTPVALSIPAAPVPAELVTTSPYDVVNKTIADMQRDMESGETTSVEITQAYLDRIKAYDMGQLGFHAFLHVSETALEQARAADEARKSGGSGSLLGIPIAIKDIYDTKDMPTTGGTKALEGWRPGSDAYQVAKLREAGAVIIGKVNTSEFANSGSFSESGWMQTWNALYPSKTSFGSSGGSAVSVAADFAAAAMGSQTGVSLYAPTTGASLTTFRGTDGMASTTGVMPLTWGQDYAGPIARTVTDLAYLLNATTGTDPNDIFTVVADADAKRPVDWTEYLDANALQGKKIGYIPASFLSSFADDDTGQAVMDKFAELEAAGATMVEMPTPPAAPTRPSGINGSTEGWARYIELHDDFPYIDGASVLASDKVLIYNKRNYSAPTRMTEEAVQNYIAYRTAYKDVIKQWMDEYEVDSVVYAGFISDVYNNDAAASQLSSDRGTGVLTSNVGLPTVVVPVGVNDSGYSISMQLVGRAWDDAKVLGMGYALEQQTQARLLTEYAPALTYIGSDNPSDPDDNDGGNPPGGNPSTPPIGGNPTVPVEDTTEQQDQQDQQETTPVEEPSISFIDTEGHWAEGSINLLISKGLLSGYLDGSFRPNKGLSRAEAIKVITTYLDVDGQPSSFSDVPAGHWAEQFIGAASQLGLMNGYSDGSFRPDQLMSRGELAALIARAFNLEGQGLVSFTDVAEGAWSYSYIDALVSNGIIKGYSDGTFKPNQQVTRAEFATIIARLLEMTSEK